VENIGIILIGIGLAMIFTSFDLPLLAALALIAGLYHTLNHALFKGLLFMGAGAVLHATHERNMEEMGGLIRFMPWTAVCFLIGCISISALPPFNITVLVPSLNVPPEIVKSLATERVPVFALNVPLDKVNFPASIARLKSRAEPEH
jgi:hypothetical protein